MERGSNLLVNVYQSDSVFKIKQQQAVENFCEVESSKRLKIRESMVRFRPRPPKSSAQLFSVGRFHFDDRKLVRGPARFYVCHAPPASEPVTAPESHTPLSLLTKLLRTLTKWHTQNALCGNDLCVCRIRRFCVRLAEANHVVCVLSHTTR